MDGQVQNITENFLGRIEKGLPSEKAGAPFIVAMVGVPGSGRTTVAKMLAEKLRGTVLVSSNSTRYLLQEAGMPWGENVRQVLKNVANDMLGRGYSIIFDGNAADQEDRVNIEKIAEPFGAKIYYVRINIDTEKAKDRERTKYDNTGWVSSFDDYRVNATEKMLQNIDDRAEVHRNLKSSDVTGLVGELDNNGSLDDLESQIQKITDKINEG